MIDGLVKEDIENFLESHGFGFSHNSDGWKQFWYGGDATDVQFLDVSFDPKEKELHVYGREDGLSFQEDQLKFSLYGNDVTVVKLQAMLWGMRTGWRITDERR